jgi:hypothetical protein
MAGTAGNYLAGNLGLGDVPSATIAIDITKAMTGANAFGVSSRINPDNTVSSLAVGFGTYAINVSGITQTPSIKHYYANQGTFAGATPSVQYGFFVEGSLTGATNNYGFYGGIAAAAGTTRYNLYMEGTADNYLAGSLGIGTASPNASAILDVQSTTKGVRMPNMTTTQKNAISSAAAGLMVFDTTLSKLCVYSGAAWQTITSV